jgi:phosphate transport system substrate-binding protein
MIRSLFISVFAVCAGALVSCGRSGVRRVQINAAGSTTLGPVVTMLAETYRKVDPTVSVTVSLGGSGQGINELKEGRIQIANSSRKMKPEEAEEIRKKAGQEPREFEVAIDALAVYVHRDNPLMEISIDQLRSMYSAEGEVTTWEGVAPGGLRGSIRLLGRETNSGTHEYFGEMVNGKYGEGPNEGKVKDFRVGIAEMNSSQAVVDTLTSTRNAVAYDGMAFKTDTVKWLAVSRKAGEAAVLPSVADAQSGKYPLSRKLYMYTVGEPSAEVKRFIDWVRSPEGQKVVAEAHCVPLPRGSVERID